MGQPGDNIAPPLGQDAVRARDRLDIERIETSTGQILALTSHYPGQYVVPRHEHSRAQLFYTALGVLTVITDVGRWLVPSGHALWVPAVTPHSVEILGQARLYSLFITPNAVTGLPETPRVVSLTELARHLILEAVQLAPEPKPTSRDGLLMALLLHEIPRLPERSLALPVPADPGMAALCHRFIASPAPQATIDEWASQLNMSRRSFTRAFARETGLSFSIWKQQACLFAALPRLASGELVTRVALDLGYESPAAFTTMFKRVLGASPRSYLAGDKYSADFGSKEDAPLM